MVPPRSLQVKGKAFFHQIPRKKRMRINKTLQEAEVVICCLLVWTILNEIFVIHLLTEYNLLIMKHIWNYMMEYWTISTF